MRFAPKPEKDATPLRDDEVDLEFGVFGALAPEIRAHLVFRDRFVGVARTGYRLLDGPVTPQRYADCLHVVASRRGVFTRPVDEALAELGLKRNVVAVVPGFPDLHSAGARPGTLPPLRNSAATSLELENTDSFKVF